LIFKYNNGTYEQTTHRLSGIHSGKCQWVDLQTDGFNDVVVCGLTEDYPDNPNYAAFIHLHGNEGYQEVQRLDNVPGPSFLAGNFDGDDRPDLLFYGTNGDLSQMYFYRNSMSWPNESPVPPQDLTLLPKGDSTELLWTPGRVGFYTEGGVTHNIRVGSTPGGSDIISPLAFEDGFRKVDEAGNTPFGSSMLITGLSPDSVYYAAVQSISSSYLYSEFTGEMAFNPVSGTLLPEAIIRSDEKIREVFWADIDDDLYPEIIVNYPLSIGMYDNQDGAIDTSLDILIAEGITEEMLLNDFDNDNDVDILQIPYSSPEYPHMLVNQGGIFSWEPIGLEGLLYSESAWGDYNTDGKSDFLTMGHVENTDETFARLFKNLGETFVETEILISGTNSGSTHWIDIDMDGDPDLVRDGTLQGFDPQPEDYVIIVNRNMNGGLEKKSQVLPGLSNSSMDFGDYDNDGDPDLLYCGVAPDPGGTPHSYIYSNEEGVFQLTDSILPLLGGSAKWFDYNNDGLLDIAISGLTDVKGLYDQIDSLMFSGIFLQTDNGFEMAAQLAKMNESLIAIADYDLDGRQDLLLCGYRYGSDTVAILYRNHTSDATTPMLDLAMNDPEVMTDEVRLSWDWKFQPALHSTEMYYNLRVGTEPGGTDVVSPLSAADGTRKIYTMGNMQLSNSFRLKDLKQGTTYYAAVQAIDRAMVASAWSEEVSFTTLGVEVATAVARAMDVKLYPVPSREEVKVDVFTPYGGEVILAIFDQTGRQVFQATDSPEGDLATFRVVLPQSGLYIARIRTGDSEVLRKFVVTEGL